MRRLWRLLIGNALLKGKGVMRVGACVLRVSTGALLVGKGAVSVDADALAGALVVLTEVTPREALWRRTVTG